MPRNDESAGRRPPQRQHIRLHHPQLAARQECLLLLSSDPSLPADEARLGAAPSFARPPPLRCRLIHSLRRFLPAVCSRRAASCVDALGVVPSENRGELESHDIVAALNSAGLCVANLAHCSLVLGAAQPSLARSDTADKPKVEDLLLSKEDGYCNYKSIFASRRRSLCKRLIDRHLPRNTSDTSGSTHGSRVPINPILTIALWLNPNRVKYG